MIRGNILNVFTGEIYPAEIEIESGIIKCVKKIKGNFKGLLVPGLIDAHIHIESSMLTPSFFAHAVVPHGTTAVVADPHEIANVMGTKGIDLMIKDSENVPLTFYFTAPSCVPATPFETSGATIESNQIDFLMQKDQIVALGEMMNFPGVINEDFSVINKIKSAQFNRKPVDGHAPLLSGEDLCKYISAGISTDHECSSAEEALEKKELGMKIMIREGSSAKNMEDLIEIGGDFLVSDDKHPEDLLEGHLNKLVQKAISLGMDPLQAIRMVTLNPAQHYSLKMGAIVPGNQADLVLVDNLENFEVEKVFIRGELVAEEGKSLFEPVTISGESSIHVEQKSPEDFNINLSGKSTLVRVIKVLEGQIVTSEMEAELPIIDGKITADIQKDILPISVVERYGHGRMSKAFVNGFEIKEGALASSVAHDSHNIIVVGTSYDYMAKAVNLLRENRGGLVAVSKDIHKFLDLPVAGLMSNCDAETVSSKLKELHKIAREMGCSLESPFMTMSFLALLVIPQLKLSDKGLFDGTKFEFVEVIKKIIE
ncbi:adenine deaminase [Methanobacterium alcaliphilum]|nr:adenine deaminase [Methanobacterium alcaliphilum]MCK9150927.1 adenine deaminase [Methanobacterium alcaliphilum]